MDLVTAAALVLVVVLLLAWLAVRRGQTQAGGKKAKGGKARATMDALDTVASWPPQATRILTVAERKAFLTLKTALPNHIVLAQVPLSRFMKVPTRNSYSEWLRRVGLMSVDILVCDAESHVIGVVDVRADGGKENARALSRHARLDRVLKAAGIPVHIWQESAIPSVTVARNAILSHAPPTTADAASGGGASSGHPVEAVSILEAEGAAGHGGREPPPSTWFDHLDSGVVPLSTPQRSPAAAPSPKRP